MIRRCVLVLFAGFALLGAQTSEAGPIAADDKVVLADSYGTTGGGEFLMTVNGDPLSSFVTFCLQRTEFISLGPQYVVNAVSTFADDLPTPDPLDSRTAWLYTQLRAGTLAGYVYSTAAADAAAHTASANLLQLAFWGLEGELALDMNNYFVKLAT